MRIIEQQLNLKKRTFRSQPQRKIALKLASHTSKVPRSPNFFNFITVSIPFFIFFLRKVCKGIAERARIQRELDLTTAENDMPEYEPS